MRSVLLLAASVLAAQCTRAPAEDFHPATAPAAAPAPPPPAAASPSIPSTPGRALDLSLAGRCVRPTPEAPPPPVPPGPAPGCPADPEHDQAVPVVTVGFPASGGASVSAWLVKSEHDTTRGLMYRRSMAEDQGMLFDLRAREDHQFWMHNTCIPLDLLYVDDDGLIVGIVENAPTLDDGARGVGCPSRYVLEVNAGWSRRHGVRAGQRLALPATG
jgi:uncharacterized membrane protein (UPF0127 family)